MDGHCRVFYLWRGFGRISVILSLCDQQVQASSIQYVPASSYRCKQCHIWAAARLICQKRQKNTLHSLHLKPCMFALVLIIFFYYEFSYTLIQQLLIFDLTDDVGDKSSHWYDWHVKSTSFKIKSTLIKTSVSVLSAEPTWCFWCLTLLIRVVPKLLLMKY